MANVNTQAIWRTTARRKATKYKINPTLFERQMGAEAHGEDLTSPAGAQGPAQIMPATARAWGVRNVHDINQAYDAAAKHMAIYLDQFGGDWSKALTAYNAGPGAVGRPLPAETKNYIAKITGGRQVTQRSKMVSNALAPAPTTAATGVDNKQLALSLLGFGSPYSDPLDPITLALQSVQQAQASAPTSSAPEASPESMRTPRGGDVVTFDNKPVASWIAPILKQARATGLWKGTVTSGVRTKSQQLSAAKRYGLQHYPHGPLASNHVEGHPGAVDVSDPQGLKRALQQLGITRLKSSMPEDPVHFSKTGF